MHIAYSSLINIIADINMPADCKDEQNDSEIRLRYLAYQTTCDKYSREIASIQKYIPGWVPKFR